MGCAGNAFPAKNFKLWNGPTVIKNYTNDLKNVSGRYLRFQNGKRFGNAETAPPNRFRASLDIDVSSPTGDVNANMKYVRWNDAMDGFLITSLATQVLIGHKRSDNSFLTFQVSKAVDVVFIISGIVVSGKNIKARLKTLKNNT